ncbi:MAG: SLBB domain-containing protein [Bacteroidetes bacterium]|nr:SLBB domain-containing protein [Bacteroidota bacterium]
MKKFFFVCLFILSVSIIKAQDEEKTSNSFSASSLRAATISVTIGGDFLLTGTFPAYLNERVDAFVTRMYNEARSNALRNITDPKLLTLIDKKLKNFSLRNITLKRSTGEVLRLDLLKYRLTGDFTNNPYLKNDDVLIFPPIDMDRDFFSISGAVNNPDKFPFVDGDKLSDAIQLAQGINKAYENVTKAEIYRLSYDGEKMDKIIVDVTSDFSLQRGDRIIVLAEETQRKEFTVNIIGEVERPGKIPITKNTTTLREVIEDAGGFTNQASLRRAKLIRGTNLEIILQNQFGLNVQQQNDYLTEYPNPIMFEYEKDRMLRTTTLTEQDTSFFAIDEMVRQMLNESSINFDSVLNENSSVANLKLKDGDYIIIPSKLNTIYVYGQVVSPGDIQYVEGKNYSYYIKLAGGLGELADDGEISLIKGTTRQWFAINDKNAKIEPGDFIYVPKNPNHSFDYYVSKLGTYLGIIGSTATIILLLLQFKK